MSNYLVWNLAGPLSWPLWLLAGALLAGRRAPKLGRRLLVAGFIWLGLAALSPLGTLLILPLEERFPRATVPDDAFIAVLGGSEALAQSRHSGRSEYNEHADRMIAGAELAVAHPAAKLAIVGGVHERGQALTDVAAVARTWRALGIAPRRVIAIGGTVDTCTNARSVAALKPRTVVLVTSAFHVPRSVACFRAAGIEPLPYPVDYLTPPITTWSDLFSGAIGSNLERTDWALHEWVGLLVYRLRGRTNELLPAPKASSAGASPAG